MSDYSRIDETGDPVLKEIMSVVVSNAASKYYEIGIELGLDIEKINAIKINTSLGGQPNKFLSEIFQEWRACECSPYKWSTILRALASDSVRKKQLADRIYRKKVSSYTLVRTHIYKTHAYARDLLIFMHRL